MSEWKTVTNNVPRDVVDGWSLSAEERAEFDYVDWRAVESGEASVSFFRYRGDLYDLGDCEWHVGLSRDSRPDPASPFYGWSGWYTDTYFSATVFRYVDDGDGDEFGSVVVGRIYS